MKPGGRCQAQKTTRIILHSSLYMTNGKSETTGWETDRRFPRAGGRKEGLTLKGHVGDFGGGWNCPIS